MMKYFQKLGKALMLPVSTQERGKIELKLFKKVMVFLLVASMMVNSVGVIPVQAESETEVVTPEGGEAEENTLDDLKQEIQSNTTGYVEDDYTAVDTAISNVPSDLTVYAEETVEALEPVNEEVSDPAQVPMTTAESSGFTLTNVALNQTVSTNPSNGNANRVTDGDTTYQYVTQRARNYVDLKFGGEVVQDENGYSHGDGSSYFIVDLGESYLIDSFTIYDFQREAGYVRDYIYNVSICNDADFTIANQSDANWTLVGSAPLGLDTCVTDFELSDKMVARYIKIDNLRCLGAASFILNEIEAYGMAIDDIEAIKAYAVSELQTYKQDIELDETVASEKSGVINESISEINAATTADAILSSLNDGFDEIDAVIALEDYKAEKKAEISNYKNEDGLFSEADKAAQLSKLEAALSAISAAANNDEIDTIVENYKKEIDEYAIIANLALNKPVSADSQEANSVRPQLAVDGDTTSSSSRWGSARNSNPHWIYVDLGEKMDVRTVKVFWETRKATKYSIQVSNNAEDWETVESFDDRPYALEEYITFTETKQARYVRLYIETFTAKDPDSDASWNTISIYELEVYAIKMQDPKVNIAKGKEAYADSREGASFHAGLAVDGDTTSNTSRWGSARNSNPHWIYVDLGEEMDVRTVKVFWETRKATKYSIQVSNDEQNWETVKQFDQRPKITNERIILDETVKARYVRLYIDTFTKEDPDTGISWNTISIYELEVYGGVIKPDLQEYLASIVVNTPTEDDKKLTYTLPELDEVLSITYNGTDYEQVVDTDLTIYRPIVDTEVLVSFKIVNSNNDAYEFIEIPVTIPGTYKVESGDNAAPTVLPELSEWKGHSGYFSISETSKIVIADESLKEMADVFAEDYKDIVGNDIDVVVGTADDLKTGDFFFTLTTDTSKGLKEEGNLMTISDSISVESETATGAYWATRTILQALKASEDDTIPKGIARDYPLYEVRGFILDVGRKTFTMNQLKQIVKQMSWYKMNDFHVHLNDNLISLEYYSDNGLDPMQAYSAFRLESDIKKGDTVVLGDEKTSYTYSADLTSKDVYYTKEEFKNFITNSKVLGVNIVPEIDTPAHSLALTKVLPELRTGTDGRENDHLDLADQYDESYDFVTNIFDEYMLGDDPVFSEDTVVHIGCDEYTAAPNAFRKFCNDMADYVEDTGRTARIWGSLTRIKGDGSVEVDGTGIQINLWNSNWANMDEMYESGFDLINCRDGSYYIVPNASYYKNYLNASTMYNSAINTISNVTIPAGDKQMIGGAFAIWNDMTDYLNNGISEYDVYVRFNDSLGLFAAKLWGKGDMTLAEAQEVSDVMGDAPNTNFGYDLEDVSAEDYDITSFENSELVTVDGIEALELKGGESYASTGLTTAGLDNTLKIKVKRTSNSTDEQILLESDYGTIKAVQKDTGKVGISRENFDYSFNYTLPVDEWVELEFKNEFEEISLYVNGELVDTLGDGDEMIVERPMVATCMFPLEKIGSETNAFVGYVAKVELSEKEIKVATADYTAVEAAKAKVPADLSIYTDESIKALEDALNAVIEGKNITEQATVDGYAKAIRDAIAGLVFKPADYTAVEAAKAKVPADLSGYTAESIQALEDALNAVVEGKNITEQATVDGYAKAIEDAIAGLVFKPADYTAVEAAKAKVPADLSGYTAESIQALEDALNAVVEGKNITEQATVDGYAGAIEAAIIKLQYKDADYAAVNKAKDKIPADLSGYTDESVKALQDAVNAVEEDLDITKQADVDAYAAAIEKAIAGLQKKSSSGTGNQTSTSGDKETTLVEVPKAPAGDAGTQSAVSGNQAATGDNSNWEMLVGVCLLCMVGVVFLNKKRGLKK